MTKGEFISLVAVIKNFYPRDNILPTNEALDCWYSAIGDIDYKDAKTAVMRHVQTNKFPPTVADIRQQTIKISGKDATFDWSDGWHKVKRAISLYGMYDEPGAMEFFDENTKNAVKRMGWESICMSENEEVCRAQFRMVYEQVTRVARDESMLPKSLRLPMYIQLGETGTIESLVENTEDFQEMERMLKQ